MKTKENVLAVLDGQFHLHTWLSESHYASVFLATHVSGVEVIVKFVWSESHFFDELARYSACEDSPYTCGCLYNYPPEVVSGRHPPLDHPLTDLEAGFHPPHPFEVVAGGEEERQRDLSQVGILILEYVPGRPLVERLNRVDDLEKVDALLELCRAVEDLKAFGISHGNLSPHNVILDSETEEIRLVGLGQVIGKRVFHPDEASPPPPATREPEPLDDLYFIGRYFLATLHRPGMKLKALRRRCLDSDPAKRPNLAEIQEGLKGLRRKLNPKKSLEILFGFLKPAHLAAWLCLVLLSTLLISHLQGARRTLPQQRNHILSKADWDSSRKVRALRNLLEEIRGEKEEAHQDLLIKDIADLTYQENGFKIMDSQDASKPIAVLAFKQAPAVIGRRDIFQLGDWIRLDDKRGYLSRIEFNRIKIEFRHAFSWHYFEKPAFPFGKAYGNDAVLVWKNENNLTRLLQGIAELNQLHFSNNNQPIHPLRAGVAPPVPATETASAEGAFAGIFLSSSTEAFLHQLKSYIDFALEDNQLVLKKFRDDIPVYFRMSQIYFNGIEITKFRDWLFQTLGYRVEIDPALEGTTISIHAYNITWQETLERLDLRWTVVTRNQEKSIVLLRSSNPSLLN